MSRSLTDEERESLRERAVTVGLIEMVKLNRMYELENVEIVVDALIAVGMLNESATNSEGEHN